MAHTLEIKEIGNVTHDVKCISLERPDGYSFKPGQATEVAIDKEFLSSKIKNFDQPFYVCGPMPFNEAMMDALKELGADPEALIFEE